jgi:hypothetical protein
MARLPSWLVTLVTADPPVQPTAMARLGRATADSRRAGGRVDFGFLLAESLHDSLERAGPLDKLLAKGPGIRVVDLGQDAFVFGAEDLQQKLDFEVGQYTVDHGTPPI